MTFGSRSGTTMGIAAYASQNPTKETLTVSLVGAPGPTTSIMQMSQSTNPAASLCTQEPAFIHLSASLASCL